MNAYELSRLLELMNMWLDEAESTRRQGDSERTFHIMRTHAYGRSDGLETAADMLASALVDLGYQPDAAPGHRQFTSIIH